MAVYTLVEPGEVQAFLGSYGVGPVSRVEAISEGIENTNYRVTAGEGASLARYVLTLFERDRAETVEETLRLTASLAFRGVPCPAPLFRREDGRIVGELRGKPAAVVPFVSGEAVVSATPGHLEALGKAVAALHLAGADLPFPRQGPHLAAVLCPLARSLVERLGASELALASLLAAEADYQEGLPEAELSQGLIHADLFLDNVLFEAGDSPPKLKALLDFHLAGRGPWLFDLAVVLADAGWCGGGVSGDSARAFLGAYRSVVPLEARELSLLPGYLRRVALRFLCLRVERFVLDDRPFFAGKGKDPWELASRLEALRQTAAVPRGEA